jgi:hypothetical protein
MAHLSDVRKELARYCQRYRHPKLPPLELSGLHSLFPEKYKKLPKEVTARWPDDDWPNGDKPGVYLFLNVGWGQISTFDIPLLIIET